MARLKFLYAGLLIGLLCCTHIPFSDQNTVMQSADTLTESLNAQIGSLFSNILIMLPPPRNASNNTLSRFGFELQQCMLQSLSERGVVCRQISIDSATVIQPVEMLEKADSIPNYCLETVLLTSYEVRDSDIIISVRLVEMTDRKIIATAMTFLPRTPQIDNFLTGTTGERLYER